MRILLISTAIFNVPPNERYGGVEALIYDFCEELVRLGVDVSLAAPVGSKPPKGVELIETVSSRRGFKEEEAAYYHYSHRIKDFDCIHDFSHQKLVAFHVSHSLPAIYVTWFEPVYFTTQRGGTPHPMPPYNVTCLSNYQARRFKQVYGYNARYQPTICKDPEKYKFCADKSDRFLFVGKMSWHKGALKAIHFCKELNVPLDIVGGKGVGDTPFYQNQVIEECDGKQVCFYPNVTDDVKIKLMQHAKAVLYPVQFTEAHNMVLVESMMCGTPVITFDKGAMSEVVGRGGYVATDDQDFKEAMKEVIDEFSSHDVHDYAVEKYARSKVVSDYVKLYKAVANGERWR